MGEAEPRVPAAGVRPVDRVYLRIEAAVFAEFNVKREFWPRLRKSLASFRGVKNVINLTWEMNVVVPAIRNRHKHRLLMYAILAELRKEYRP